METIKTFTLLMDRNQQKPMIIVKDIDANEYSDSNPQTKTYRGLLMQYNFPKESNYRVVTTFSGINYLYFFGEKLPIITLSINFSDGTTYIPSDDKKKDYNSLYIHNNVDEFMSGNGAATIFFNRIVIHGNILDVDASGDSGRPGTLGTQVVFAVKSYYIPKAEVGEKDEKK